MILKNTIRAIKSAKETGVSLNALCVKLKATKGAMRSMIFKLWRKVLPVKTITLANNGTVISSDFASFAAGDYVAIHYVKNWLESYSRVNGINTKMVIV